MTSSQQKTQSASTNAPWEAQAPYITAAFNDAGNALSSANFNAAGNNPAPTQFTAQYTPAMMQAFQGEMNYGTGNPNISASSAAAGGGLTASGMNATNSGLYGLANYQNGGTTQSTIDAANQYADNPAISGMVQSAMRDANQNYQSITSPGIDRNSAGTGNINSSTNGVAHGIVERGLAQQAGDISSNLRGQAYTTGLGLAQQKEMADNTNTLGALYGLTSGGTGAVNSGVNANTGAVGQQTGLFNIANTGASNVNSGNQAADTNALQSYQFGQNSPFAALNNYFNIVGNKSWGSQGTGTSTQTSTPSALSSIGQGVGIFGSLIG